MSGNWLFGSGRYTRRDLLASATFGVGSVALATLLRDEQLLANPAKPDLERKTYDTLPKPPMFPPRATAMISLFMQGGPSSIDLFEVKYDNAAQASSVVMGPPWKFNKHGESGMEFSELLPHTASVADELCMLRGMHTDVNNHGQSIDALNNGRPFSGRPALGSWLTYGLGTENRNLPAYVVLADAGYPVLGAKNWSNGWLPSLYQGTVVRNKEPRILNLDPPVALRGALQEQALGLLRSMNRDHLERHPGESDLEARIASYELAARMQTAAKEAFDISQETEATQKLYGLDEDATRDYGTRCLIARRLVERGVRFVQVFTTTQEWDHHGNIRAALPVACKKTDKPAAALVQDLKQRGLLSSTLVHWGGEMGRLPVIQNNMGINHAGRDHNTYGFTMWLAGGGVKGGLTYGETDDFGHKAVKDTVSHVDYHITLLHLFGLDYKKLVYRRNNQEQSLNDQQAGRLVQEILA